jgi:hypothetical protein
LALRFLLALLPAALAAETLTYTINWPSGLSLGEGRLSAGPTPEGRRSELTLEASIPGVPVIGDFLSRTEAQGCTTEFVKKLTFGTRKIEERTTSVPGSGEAERKTGENGGKSKLAVGPCPRDALAFLDFLRRELAAGRIPGEQQILFGAVYTIKLQHLGAQRVAIGGEMLDADRFQVNVRGPASNSTFELVIGRDAARTPLLAVVPFTMGAFRLELAR